MSYLSFSQYNKHTSLLYLETSILQKMPFSMLFISVLATDFHFCLLQFKSFINIYQLQPHSHTVLFSRDLNLRLQ